MKINWRNPFRKKVAVSVSKGKRIEGYARQKADHARIQLKQQKAAAAAKAAEEYQAYVTEWELDNRKSNNIDNGPPLSILDLYDWPRGPKKVRKPKRNPRTGRFEKSTTPDAGRVNYGKLASTRNLSDGERILIASAAPMHEPKPLSLKEFTAQKDNTVIEVEEIA